MSEISGNNKLKITDHELRDSYAACSRDGKEIAFTTNHDGDYDIFVIN